MVIPLITAIVGGLASLAIISSNVVIILQQLSLHRKVDDTKATVNGRMDELLHEAKKSAALEALTPSDIPE